jgi:hypothetical protein
VNIRFNADSSRLIVAFAGCHARREPMMKAAIYARVSTTDQTCEKQLREIREYVRGRG